MPDKKISQLVDGGASQALDAYVIARTDGVNYKIAGTAIAAAATSVGTLTSLTVSGDLTVDTSTLKVDSTNNRVGVGTASPGYVLDAQATSSPTIQVRNTTASTGNFAEMRLTVANTFSGTGSAYLRAVSTNGGNSTTDLAFGVNASGGGAASEAMRLDASGNLGLGTSTPSTYASGFLTLSKATASGDTALTIRNAASPVVGGVQGTILNFINDSGSNTALAYIQSRSNDGGTGSNGETSLSFGTYNGSALATRMKLDYAGNLGLGVTPSAWGSIFRAEQIGNGGSFVAGRTDGISQTQIGSNAFYDGTNWKYVIAGSNNAARYYQNGGEHIWDRAGAGTGGNNISWTQAMTLDASGNLGVGTTGPSSFGKAAIVAASGTTSFYTGTGAQGLYISTDDSTRMVLYASSGNFSGGHRWNVGNTEAARITAGGELCVGVTGTNASERLIVRGVGATNATYITVFENSSGSRAFSIEGAGRIDTGTLGDSPYNYVVGGTNRDLYVDSTGKLGYVSSVLASKTNIAPVTDADWLLNLNPVTFNFRKKDEDGNYTDEADGPLKHGLIAEEVEAVNPDLCFYDDEASGGALRGVNYTHLITPMLKLVQAQQAKIESLEARLAALES